MDPERRKRLQDMHVEYRATRDRALRNELVQAYEGFASALAARYGDRRDGAEDRRQVALIGLLTAVERFDPDHGAEFLTFAWATIIGALRRHRRDHAAPMRMSRSLQARAAAVASCLDWLTQTLGRSPTVPEVAEAMGMSVEMVIEAMEARGALQPLSIDLDADGTGAFGAKGDVGLEHVELRELVGPMLARLPAREQELLRLRFIEERSQTEIAACLGISQMHVSRLLARTLHQLRTWMEEGRRAHADQTYNLT